MAKERLTQSQIDGVDYRRAKLWQIILVAFNAFNGMAMYFLIGLASYSASIGYGIATLVVGGLLTFTRIFDAITDPLLAFLYDRFNTPFGKVRPLMLLGWLIQSAGVYCLFTAFSSKGHGIPVFLACFGRSTTRAGRGRKAVVTKGAGGESGKENCQTVGHAGGLSGRKTAKPRGMQEGCQAGELPNRGACRNEAGLKNSAVLIR